MNAPSSLIDAFVRGRERLLRVADEVPAHLRTTPFVGQWNLMDVLAHLAGWDYTNLSAIEEFKAGRTPAFYREYDPGWATYNQQLIDRFGAEDWTALRETLRQSQEAVVSMLRLLTDEELTWELTDRARRHPITIATILRAAIKDEREHLQQIRTLLEASGTASE